MSDPYTDFDRKDSASEIVRVQESGGYKMKIIAADRMAIEIDRLINTGKLNARSPLADARLEYDQPNEKLSEIDKLKNDRAELIEAYKELLIDAKNYYMHIYHKSSCENYFKTEDELLTRMESRK